MAIYTSDSIFEKMEQQDFEVIPQNEWLQDFAAHIEKQIEPDNGSWVDERSEAKQIECLPKEVKTIYYLWWFNVFTGSINSIESYLVQGQENIIKGSYESLMEVGAETIARYLANYICNAISKFDNNIYSCEFCVNSKDLSWFRSLNSSGEDFFVDDTRSSDVLFDELDVLAIEYIQKNLDILVE